MSLSLTPTLSVSCPRVSAMGPEIWGIQLAQSWAEVLAAVVTTGALVVAAGVYWSQQRDRRDDEAGQARMVVRTRRVWAPPSISFAGQARETAPKTYRVALAVSNRSDLQIYSPVPVRIDSRTGWREPPIQSVHAPPDAIEPGETFTMVTIEVETLPDDRPSEYHYDLEFEFVDACGRRWRRKSLEQPRRIRQWRDPRGRLSLAARLPLSTSRG